MPDCFLVFIGSTFYKFSYAIIEQSFRISCEKIIQAYGKEATGFKIVFRGKAAGSIFHTGDLLAGNSQMLPQCVLRHSV